MSESSQSPHDDPVRWNRTVYSDDKVAGEYAKNNRNPAVSNVVRGRAERFIATLSRQPKPRVLDVGCADGRESELFANDGLTVVGCDFSLPLLRIAQGRQSSASLVAADMRQLPVGREAFDGLWASASFLNIPKDQAASTLAEFNRVLMPNGTLYLSVMQGDHDDYRKDQVNEWPDRYFAEYQPDELAAHLQTAGFAITEQVIDPAPQGVGITFLAYFCHKHQGLP